MTADSDNMTKCNDNQRFRKSKSVFSLFPLRMGDNGQVDPQQQPAAQAAAVAVAPHDGAQQGQAGGLQMLDL